MTFFKKNRVLLILAFLLGSFIQVKAQCNDAVSLRCVAVDSTGNITLTWTIPSNISSCGGQSFTVYVSTSRNSGYTAILPPVAIAQPYTTIPKASLPASPNTARIYFYIQTNNLNNPSYNSDTASSIYLSLTNSGGGVAQLYWNAVSNPPPGGSDKWYQIWREYKYNWSLIDSTQNLSYWDTITYCDSSYLKYRVEVADSTICTSVSNIATSSGKFINTIGPPMVVMDTTSVTSGNGIDITWRKSNKKNVVGYIVYYQVIQKNGTTYDTSIIVNGINTDSLMNYFNAGNPADSSIGIAVAAFDSCYKAGAISNPQNTIYLKISLDLCKQTNTLNWTGYQNLAGSIKGTGIGGYRVFRSINNSLPYQLLANLDSRARSYVDSNLSLKEITSYYVQVYDSTNSNTTASSNIVTDTIKTATLPKNNYLRTASVIFNTSSIQVLGYIDSTSGAGYYSFQRSLDSTGNFTTIYTMTAPANSDSISYIDNSANPDVYSYSYRILTLNNCKRAIDSTNLGETMLLTAVGLPNSTNVLTWNDYGNWYEGPAYYILYRSVDGINYTSLSPTVKYTNARVNTYTDNIDGITNGQGTFYYYIKAVEDSAKPYPYTFIDTSYSNIAKAYQAPTVFVPDAFCPTGKNKIFIPVGVFINSQGYDLSILNRWGDLVFESKDPDIGWDGTYKGGKIVQEGVYVYLLTYTSSRGEYYQQKGTVTLIK